MEIIKQSDNLEFMSTIDDNSVDLIYCDILYGTGRDFGDYIDLSSNKDEIEKHYIPRLKQMFRILKNSGSIYLQMDYRISHWVRCIMDDIFGYDNFRREIIWDVTVLSGYKTMANNWILAHQNIYFYSKSSQFIFNKLKQPHTQKYLESFNKIDENGENYFTAHKKNHYLKDAIRKGKVIGDVWNDIKSFQQQPTATERKLWKYETQKPETLLNRIIMASSNEGDLVADFYCGSGVTPSVCKQLNRNFIGCDISQKAVDITKRRLGIN